MYPEWFDSFRDHQRIAIDDIVRAFQGGAKVVILDAPTGSGKTLIGEAVRQEMEMQSSLYVCSTKSLQDQFIHDFPYGALLKGRSNYPTFYDDKARGDDCTETQETPCMWCPEKKVCPYEIAKVHALKSPLAVINTAYMLAECNGPGRFAKRDFVIADEADVLEAELMRHVGLEIGSDRARRLRLSDPQVVTVTAKRAQEEWVAWSRDAIEKVKDQIPPFYEGMSLREIRARKAMLHLFQKLVKVSAGIASGGWIYTGKGGYIAFKPIRVNEMGPHYLWGHASRFLLMSATIISPDELAESLGLEQGTWDFVSVASSFPPENRPIKITPIANMARKPGDGKTPEGEREKMAAGIVAVCKRHHGERVLVHTVSYDLSASLRGYLEAASGRRVLTYSDAAGRQTALDAWLRTQDGILLAPSFDRGIDLADDKCRVVVVAKVPFPYLGDRQIAARLYTQGGQQWYTVQTVRTIVQMTGRATRNENDYSTTYILDEQFAHGLWNKGRRLFPSWWVDALDWRDKLSPIIHS